MKKLLSFTLAFLMAFTLFGCGSNKNTETDNIDANSSATVDTSEYETTDFVIGDKTYKIAYDPEGLKLGTTGVSDTNKRFSGVKRTFLMSITTLSYDSMDAYKTGQFNAINQSIHNENATVSDIETLTYGTTTIKKFTVQYDSKVYTNMEKEKEYTDAELQQLEYTLEPRSENFYAIELSDGNLLKLLVSSGEDYIEDHFAYITIE